MSQRIFERPFTVRTLAKAVLAFFFLGSLTLFAPLSARAELAPRPPFEPDPIQLSRLQRTVTLLQNATASSRATVRVLFYGQSHTLTPWWEYLSAELTNRYPNVDFVITNKAVHGFQAVGLSHACLADVGPWQPDLIFLHCYGTPDDHERLYSRVRSICTADVVVQADHPFTSAQVDENIEDAETNPESPWVWRNYYFLPRAARLNDFCWADIRTEWKRYLHSNELDVRTLLGPDQAHFNEDGNLLETELLAAFLKPHEFQTSMDPWNYSRIQTKTVGKEIHWVDDSLDLRFIGSRVDVIYDPVPPEDPSLFSYTLDGSSPTQHLELMGFDRVSQTYWIDWPGILSVSSQAPLLEETWTLRVESMDDVGSELAYSVRGSKTGFDGNGSNYQTFVSNSRRVVIFPGQVTIGNAFNFTHMRPPDGYEVTWNSSRRFVETFKPIPAVKVGTESVETLFLGTSDSAHTLRIFPKSGASKGIRAIRVYSPAGQALVADRVPVTEVSTGFTAQREHETTVIRWPIAWGVGRLEFTTELGPESEWLLVAGVTSSAEGFRIEHRHSSTRGYYRWRPQ